MISFAVCRCCGCLGFGVDGVTLVVVAMLFMGASSLALAVAFHAMRGMYLHAERLLAKAGVATARGGGSPTLETKRSESGKGAAKRRAAQPQRGSLGMPLAGARGGAPE